MSIEAVENYQNVVMKKGIQPSFSGTPEPKAMIKEEPDTYEKAAETKTPTGKKIGLGVASYLLPGLGQFINGDNKKGWILLGAGIVAKKSTQFFNRALMNVSAAPKAIKLGGRTLNFPNIVKSSKGMAIGGLISYAVLLGAKIWSVIDAVKKAKPNAKTV